MGGGGDNHMDTSGIYFFYPGFILQCYSLFFFINLCNLYVSFFITNPCITIFFMTPYNTMFESSLLTLAALYCYFLY